MWLNLVILLVIIFIQFFLKIKEKFSRCPPNSDGLKAVNSIKTLSKSSCTIDDLNNFYDDLEESETENKFVCIGKNMEPANSIDTSSKAWCRKKNN